MNFGEIDTRVPKDQRLWDPSKLEVGNIFYGCSYFETVKEVDVQGYVLCIQKNMQDRSVRI